MKDLPSLSYVLVTPARNEESFIKGVLNSVVSQTILPLRWVIVSDASTDKTDEIVSEFLDSYPWIELVRMPREGGRNFASKVHCFDAGLRRLAHLPYDIVGNLDADITFERDYFEFLLGKFAADSGLGVAGTPFVEETEHYDFRYASVDHVSGACQLFRRNCFEEIGGYTPIQEGGIDWVAVTTARMKGWRTRTFLEKTCTHHRRMGTGNRGRLAAFFNSGKIDYTFGGHPLWQLSRALFHMTKRPFVIGGVLLGSGYAWGWITCTHRPLSKELLVYYRREQMSRLRNIFRRIGPRGNPSSHQDA